MKNLQQIAPIYEKVQNVYHKQCSIRQDANKIRFEYMQCSDPKKAGKILKTRSKKMNKVHALGNEMIELSRELTDTKTSLSSYENKNENYDFNFSDFLFGYSSQNMGLAI